MGKTEDERFMERVAAVRDDVLCCHMEAFYRSLSREEIYTLWERRGAASLMNNEALLVRDIIRATDGLGRAPPTVRMPPSAPVDWWSAPRDQDTP